MVELSISEFNMFLGKIENPNRSAEDKMHAWQYLMRMLVYSNHRFPLSIECLSGDT